ncbi:LysR family transcriptional regulator [Paraburkholderia sp. Ac-20342]|uniref:LysR family transcriptional regulator n=1 Tax=Paraburkholderia sp. Ac-20342 TaxID=2703889 RepID=UPI001981A26D|nr:LysR family transcriptional regulator [Paraburkholderia sp. Ac-20342]MBN3851406.1 LysR family transcriptional regulator [Paraburkholderia sp. Ac-20342]
MKTFDMMRGLDLESARLFIIAYEEGSLTRAAERSNIAVSAVTKRLQDLEYVFGVSLFNRHARGVTATPAGDEFARQIRLLMQRLNETASAMREFSEGIRGRVRIASSQSAIVGGLAAFAGTFVKTNPEIAVDLQEIHGWSLVPEITSGRADLGLSLSVLEVPSSVTTVPYKAADLIVAVPKDHPLSSREWVRFEDLIDFEHITLGPKSTLCSFLVNQAATLGHELRYRAVSSFDVMRSMIAAGLGIGILSEIMVPSEAESLGLRCLALREDWARASIRIYYCDDLIPPSARLFLKDLLLAQGQSSPLENAELKK